MRTRVVRVESDGAFELRLGTRPVPIVIGFDPCQRGVGFGECVIDFKRSCRGVPGPGVSLRGRECPVGWEKVVAVS